MTSEHIPSCVGIILDGNRRWAKERGLPTLEGHRAGLRKLEEAVGWVRARGVRHLAVYAFSTENWKRTEEEVSYLMELFIEAAGEALARASEEEKARVRFVGALDMLPEKVRSAIAELESKSAKHDEFTLWVCLSYGSRQEIIEAARRAGPGVTEESLRRGMWTAEMPDPEVIVRTGGEKRLSNFLLWQAAYSELFFIEPYWPDFSEELLDGVLDEYQARERRMGR